MAKFTTNKNRLSTKYIFWAAENIKIPKISINDAQDIRIGLLKNERFEMTAFNRQGT